MKYNTLLGIILTLFFFWSCESNSQRLEPITEIPLKISEPSGITYHNNHLFIVSDNDGIIYKTNLKGKIKGRIKTKLNDVEGIAYVKGKSKFLLTDERRRTIVEIDQQGNVLSKHKIGNKQGSKNSGLEGICINSERNELFVLNEKNPKQLIRLNINFEVSGYTKINFAKDLSGCCFYKGNLWLVSDQSHKIYKVSSSGELLSSYKIPVDKAEGIVIVKDLIYVVSDSRNKLYTFNLPD